jgi:hypothetical protein
MDTRSQVAKLAGLSHDTIAKAKVEFCFRRFLRKQCSGFAEIC